MSPKRILQKARLGGGDEVVTALDVAVQAQVTAHRARTNLPAEVHINIQILVRTNSHA